MKKLLANAMLAIALSVAPALSVNAAVNALIINRTDGVSEYFKLDPDLNVMPSETGGILMVHPSITVEYLADEVENFTYGAVEGDDLYQGDHQLAIDAPEAPRRDISIAPDEISASGVDALELFDTAGRRVRAAKAADGSATLSLASLPKGIYILRAGSTTMKIKI